MIHAHSNVGQLVDLDGNYGTLMVTQRPLTRLLFFDTWATKPSWSDQTDSLREENDPFHLLSPPQPGGEHGCEEATPTPLEILGAPFFFRFFYAVSWTLFLGRRFLRIEDEGLSQPTKMPQTMEQPIYSLPLHESLWIPHNL